MSFLNNSTEAPTAAASASEVPANPVRPVLRSDPVQPLLGPIPAGEGSPIPASAPAQVTRPGISHEMLARAGIVQVDAAHASIGMDASGLLIPYRNLDGTPLLVNGQPYHRLRVDRPAVDGPKYLAPANSGSQLYIPPGLPQLLQHGGTLTVTEGEFKALALVEAGIAAVAVSGITCTCPNNSEGNPVLLPALAGLIAEFGLTRVEFAGDNDTALIAAFSREMVKLKRCLGAVALALPRIPFDAPGKGPDDLRQVLGDGFPAEWERFRAIAEPVEARTWSENLVSRLLNRESQAMSQLVESERDMVRKKLVELGVAFHYYPITVGDIAEFAAAVRVDKTTFRTAMRQEMRDRFDAEQQQLAATLVSADVAEPFLVFDGTSYYHRDNDRDWGKIGRADALLAFASKGLSRKIKSDGMSPAEEALLAVQREHRADFAGPICGRQPGLIRLNGKKILVTSGPTFIAPAPGEFPTISRVLASLFGATVPDSLHAMQLTIFMAWLKLARIAVQNPDRHLPGQMLGLVGPRDCGKSLVQSLLITPSLGGRAADPGLFLTRRSTFNSDFWGAEHLALGDESLGDNFAQRNDLQDEAKKLVASSEYPLHPKHQAALTLPPVWRLTLSANEDYDSATSLPALDANFQDKVIYLKGYAPPAPFYDEQSVTGRQEFVARLRAELPAFLHAVDAFEIPAALRKARFGVTEWHHPEVVSLIRVNSKLEPLMDAITELLDRLPEGQNEVCLSALALYERLDTQLTGGVRTVANGIDRLGHQLHRLSQTDEWRGVITKEDRRGGTNRQRQTVWRIRRVTPLAA
jgi:hypothetical protein